MAASRPGSLELTVGDAAALPVTGREVGDSDIVFEERGVKVVVDETSLELIDGTEVDFVKEGLNEAFRFRNPNVTGECGCGESFSV